MNKKNPFYGRFRIDLSNCYTEIAISEYSGKEGPSLEQTEHILRVWRKDPDRGLRLLIDAYAGPVWKIVRHRLGGIADEADMEETVNDIFLELAAKAEHIDEEKGALTAFVLTLARRRTVDAYRRLARRREFSSGEPRPDEPAPDNPEALLLQKEERRRLLALLTALGEPETTILFRRFYYGETYAEIGRVVHLSENAVNKRCLKALETLREQVKGDAYHD